ncbi:MAG TPA: cupin domain-containing protein [Dehalococcoidia bacterium]|nr:cupin domain-containing protein [Dehalococcoidia bacterium]
MTTLSNQIVLMPGQGKHIDVPGHPIEFKATSGDTRGAYALIEGRVTGDGPPQHVHQHEEEAFYILEGELNVKLGDETVNAKPGAFILVPRGTTHTFWNAGSTPAKLLVLFSPGGFEDYFAEVVGEGNIDTETFIARGMAVAEKYHLDIVGPPLG